MCDDASKNVIFVNVWWCCSKFDVCQCVMILLKILTFSAEVFQTDMYTKGVNRNAESYTNVKYFEKIRTYKVFLYFSVF